MNGTGYIYRGRKNLDEGELRMGKWDQYHVIHYGVLALFMGIMVYVTFLAYSRHSGFTGLDMVKIQQMRYEALIADKPK